MPSTPNVSRRVIAFQAWAAGDDRLVRALRAPRAAAVLSEVMRPQVRVRASVPWTDLPVVSEIDTFPGLQSGIRWGFLLDTANGTLTDWTGLDTLPPFELEYGRRFDFRGLTLGETQRALLVAGGNTRQDALQILLGGLFWVSAGSQFVFAPYEHNLLVNLPGPEASTTDTLYAVRTSRGDFVGTLSDVLLHFWQQGHLRELYSAAYTVVYPTLDPRRPTAYEGEAGAFSLAALRDQVFAEGVLLSGGITISAGLALREIEGGATAGQTLLRQTAYAEAAMRADANHDREDIVRIYQDGMEYFSGRWPDWLDDRVTGLPTITVQGYHNLGRAYLIVSVADHGSALIPVENFGHEAVLAGLGNWISRVGVAVTPAIEQGIFSALFFSSARQSPDVTWTEGGVPRWIVYADLGALRHMALKTARPFEGPFAICDSWTDQSLPISEFVAGRMTLYWGLAEAFAANHGAPENRQAHSPKVAALAAPAAAPTAAQSKSEGTAQAAFQSASVAPKHVEMLLRAYVEEALSTVYGDKVTAVNGETRVQTPDGQRWFSWNVRVNQQGTLLYVALAKLPVAPLQGSIEPRAYGLIRRKEDVVALIRLLAPTAAVEDATDVSDAPQGTTETLPPAREFTETELKRLPTGSVLMDALGGLVAKGAPDAYFTFTVGRVGTDPVSPAALAKRGPLTLILSGKHGRKDLRKTIRVWSSVWDSLPLFDLEQAQLWALLGKRIEARALPEAIRTMSAQIQDARDAEDLARVQAQLVDGVNDVVVEETENLLNSLGGVGKFADLDAPVEQMVPRLVERVKSAVVSVYNERAEELGAEPMAETIDYEGLEEAGQAGLFGSYAQLRERKPRRSLRPAAQVVQVVEPVPEQEHEEPEHEEPESEEPEHEEPESQYEEPTAPESHADVMPDELLTKDFRDVHSMREQLFRRGWKIIAQYDKAGEATTNPYSAARILYKNRLTDQEAEIQEVTKKQYLSGGQWAGEDQYKLTIPADWEIEYQQALQQLHALPSPDAPNVSGSIPGNELVNGDVIIGLYASEIRLWIVDERKVHTLAMSNTMRGRRFIQTTREGARSADAPDFTPAKIRKQPGEVVRAALQSIGIVLPQGTRLFWQQRSTAGADTFAMTGRIGQQKAETAAANDPWLVPLSAEEEIKAQAEWDAVKDRDWMWVGELARLVSSDGYASAGSISAAVGVVLRAAGVDATMRMSTGTGYGHVDIRFPAGQKEKLLQVLQPNRVYTDTASFTANAKEDKSDAMTDYYAPGGAKINPDYAQAFLRAYVGSSHAIEGRSGFRRAGTQKGLARWIWQQQLTKRAEAGAAADSRGQYSRGEKRASWESPTFGTVMITEGAEGRRDTWHNISAVVSGKRMRYGYNGSRWARSETPPEALLAEVTQEGWGHLFGRAE